MTARIRSLIAGIETSWKAQAILLAAITVMALGLRLYKLGDWSFWIDEIFTVQGSRFIGDWRLPRLPIYLVLTRWSTNLLGTSEWSARLLPAIIGGLTPAALYWPVKRIFNTPTALLAAFLLAIAPWHLWWSQNARFYALLVLFYNLGLLLLFIGLENNRLRYILPGLLILFMAGRERDLGFLFIPVLVVYILLLLMLPFKRPAWLRPRNLLLLLLPALVFLAYDAYHFSQTGSSAVRTFFLYFAGNPIDSPVRILILILFNIGLPVVALSAFSGVWLASQKSSAGLFLLAAAVVPIFLLIGVSAFTFTVDRYALVTLPAWLILAAAALERLASWLPQQGRWLAAATLCILVADAGGALLMYYQLNEGNRPDWRGSFQYVAANMEDEDLIVSVWPEIGYYYLGDELEIQDLDDIDPAALAGGRRNVWFVVDTESIWFSPLDKKQWMEANAELLFVRYLRTREQLNMKVYHYAPAGNAVN